VARPPRLNVGGAFFHVTARGAAARTIFRDDEDRLAFLDALQRTTRRRRWLCHGYCLMDTHYHLVVETSEPNLSQGMHVLNGCYARSFNRRHGGRGHVFDARFYSGLMLTEAHVLATVRYVVLNPVRAGLCTAPGDWPWSSYRALVGADEPVAGLIDRNRTLSLLDAREAAERVRQYVEGDLFTTS
jgi:putative transposase